MLASNNTRWKGLPGRLPLAAKIVGLGRAGMGALLTQRERWPLWIPVLIGFGVIAYFLLPVEPAPWTALVSGLVFLPMYLLRRSEALRVLVTAWALICLGFVAAQWRSQVVSSPILERKLGVRTVTGEICRIEFRGEAVRVILADPVVARLAPEKTPRRLRITFRGKTARDDLEVGGQVRFRAGLLPLPEPDFPGGFDIARYLYFQGLGGLGYGVTAPTVLAPSGEKGPQCRDMISSWRQRAGQQIRAALDGDRGAVALALLIGDRSELPEATLQGLRDSGLAHLLAISGLHVGLLAGVIFFAVRAGLALVEPVALRYPIKKWAAFLALLGAVLYLLLTGATIPTQRAVIMLGIVLLAVMLDRVAISMRGVAVAASVILLYRPESLLSASFHLSFAAVVALVAVYEALRERFSAWRLQGGWPRKVLLYLFAVALTTLIAGLATAPFAMSHFNRVAAYSLPANLVAVPVMGLWVMPWAVISFLAMPFSLAKPALEAMALGLDAILWVAETVAASPGAAWDVASPRAEFLPLITLAGLWLCLWRGRLRLPGLAGLIAAMLLLALPADRPLLLADKEGDTLAVITDTGGLQVSGGMTSSRQVQNWRRHWNLRPEEVSTEHVRCDRFGCILELGGYRLAWAKHPLALAEDCGLVDFVIAAIPVPESCRPPLGVIHRFDFWRHGAHAIYASPDGRLKLSNVSEIRGRRPWTVLRPPERRRQ